MQMILDETTIDIFRKGNGAMPKKTEDLIKLMSANQRQKEKIKNLEDQIKTLELLLSTRM